MESSLTAEIWNERLRLAVLKKVDLIYIGLFAAIIGLLTLCFHFLGNTTDVSVHGRSALTWMINRWSDGSFDADYSHGWLIPMVSIGIIWWKRKEILAAPKKVTNLGLVLIVLSLLFHWAGAKSAHPRLSLFGLVLLLWSIPYYLYGWKTAKYLIFPVAYLIFCIPLNFLDGFSFKLQRIMSHSSAMLLNGFGLPVDLVDGNKLMSRSSGFSLEVAAACSGLRSLLAITALTAVYAYLTQRTFLKKWFLFLMSIPLAIIGNMARITSICLVAEGFGQKVATGTYHDYSGYLVFAVVIVLMVALGTFLSMNHKKEWMKWKRAILSPT